MKNVVFDADCNRSVGVNFSDFEGALAFFAELDSRRILNHYFHIWCVRKRAATEIFKEVVVLRAMLFFETDYFPIGNLLDRQDHISLEN